MAYDACQLEGYLSEPFVGVGSTQLKVWIRRAATANSFDDLLVEP